MTPSLFSKRKSPFLLKWQLRGCSSSVVPWWHCPGDYCLGVWNDIFSLQKRFCPVYSCEAVPEKALDPEVLHMLSEIHHDRENLVPQCVELTSFWNMKAQRWPWHWYYAHGSLCPNNFAVGKGCVMGHIWAILPLKPWEFNDGHHELLLWRYVEVDGKEIHQMGGPLGSTILSTSSDSEPPLSSGSQDPCGF